MTDQFRFKGFFNFGLLRFLQKIAILFVAYFAVNTLLGQNDTTGVKYKISKPNNPDKSKQNSSNVDLDDPLKVEWKYNSKTNRYESFKQLGSLTYPTGESLSVTEYFQVQSKEKNSEYYRKKTQNTDYYHC